MRLHSVILLNFRGVDELDVEFADNGITVVEGDNGTGKTSLMQAVDLIFRYPDSSRAQPIEDIKPEGKDIGAEIKLTATLGRYRMTYEKRYHRNKSTRLEIHGSQHELLTGREAHDRATEIFEANVDVPLFRALWLQQGVELGQADLSAQTSLGAALDLTAGEPVDNESESTLFQRVSEEYERYFTVRGQPKIESRRLIEDHDSAVAAVEDMEGQLATLDEKVEQVSSLSQRASNSQQEQKEQAERVNSLAVRWQEIEKRLQQVEGIQLQAEIAVGNREAARLDLKTRNGLIEAVATATKNRDELASRFTALSPGIMAAQTAFDAARQRWEQAKTAFDNGQSLLRLREADFEYRRDEFDRLLMTERQERVTGALASVREADQFLSSCRIDNEKLADIELTHTSALTTRARLEGESAHIDLDVFSPQQIEIEGDRRQVSAGEQLRRTVEGKLVLELPEVLRVTVTAGQGSESLAEALRTVEADLRNKLEAVGASDVSDARGLDRRRVETEANKGNSQSVLRRDLRDLTPEQLGDRVEDLIQKTDRYVSERDSAEPLPEDLDTSRSLRDATLKTSQTSWEDFERSERNFESAENDFNNAKKGQTELGVELRVAGERLGEAGSAVNEARAAEVDATITDRVRKLEEDAQITSDAHKKALSELEQSNPEAVKVELRTAEQVAQRISDQISELEEQLRDARSYLSIKGEEGLHDDMDEAKTRMEHTRRVRVAEEARATAAKKLFETMARHRDQARHRYLAPFREKIESLGRIVFGPQFTVDLDNDFRIERADVTGVSLRFSQHSTGEREQLGMIARLACASIVSENGGVPLILDDALGWTDPGKLQTIGAALTVGSRDCQVIALTCEPGRYRHVGAEKVVTII